MVFYRLACIAMFAVVACQTPSGSPVLLDGEEAYLKMEPANQLARLPPSLWSPVEKEATAGYHFLLAEQQSLYGQSAKAHENFKLAHELDGNEVTAEKYLAATIGSLAPEEGRKLAQKFALLHPHSPRIMLIYARAASRVGDSVEAVKYIKRAIKIRPDSDHGYLQLAAFYRVAGDYDKVEATLRQLLKQRPDSLNGLALLMKLYIDRDKLDKALSISKSAFRIAPTVPEVVIPYVFLHQKHGYNGKAASVFAKLAAKQSTDQDWVERIALIRRFFGPNFDIVSSLKEMADQLGGEERYFLRLQAVFAMWDAQKVREASDLANSLRRQRPYAVRLLYLSAMGFEKLGELEHAEKLYKKIDSYSDHYIAAQLKISSLLLAQKRWEDALDTILRLMHYRFVTWEVYLQAASLYSLKEKYASAVSVLQAGYERFPKKIRLLFLQGVYQERQGDLDATIDVMQQVIELDPTHSSAHNYLGYLYAEMDKNLEEAEHLIKTALSLKPGDGYYLDSLGWVYYKQGRYEKALEVLSEALRRVPTEGVVIEHLGDVYLALERRAEALKMFHEAMKYLKEDRDRARLHKKIRGLSS